MTGKEKEEKLQSAAGKAEEKEWPKYITQLIAITTLFLAVCATFASLKAGAYSSKAILAQNQASNAWAYYQAKSLKENAYKIQLDNIKMHGNGLDAEQADKFQEKYAETVARYQDEEKEITEQAKTAETERDRSQIFNKAFAGALTFLQIGILLASLSALTKLLYFWYIGLAIGGYGVYAFLTTLLQT